jgi:CheY-like chemotaxis protein
MSKRILIVEDDPDIQEIYVRRLRREGYEAEIAGDGREALRRLEDGEDRLPCLVLTDFTMPRMNGRELIEAMRKDDLLIALPVVMVSSSETNQAPDGVEFIRKPIEMDAILERVKEFCGDPEEKCPTAPEKSRRFEQASPN